MSTQQDIEIEIDRCPICNTPTHATDGTDDGTCMPPPAAAIGATLQMFSTTPPR